MFMAIDNLDRLCSEKKEDNNSQLNYQTTKFFPDLPECEDFESYNKRKKLAERQLQVIGRYLKDYKVIIEKFDRTAVNQESLARIEEEDSKALQI